MWVFGSLGLGRFFLCCFACSCFVGAHAPGWVKRCGAGAHVRKDRVLACGSAKILDGDVDYATSIASTNAKGELADFILKTQRLKPTKKVRVEVQGTKLDAKWVGQTRVYVLLSMGIEESKRAKIVAEQPKQEGVPGTKQESGGTGQGAPVIKEDGQTKQ